ncbi:hypothetical protein BKA65DRAFT_516139 [Rhexocercosporidium sp. MPI-PUGE-AT-0058]|nr:hypothetical protein BKA65DRAFT_516139 [Rhexocercosporidium sp. MPI-PUGE-AT-0058]
MSWVSSRRTSVPEDIAYCLLGIFDVNMPLLYGEGSEKAFLRLQEAILKSSDDSSIFLWRSTETEASTRNCGDYSRNSQNTSQDYQILNDLVLRQWQRTRRQHLMVEVSMLSF